GPVLGRERGAGGDAGEAARGSAERCAKRGAADGDDELDVGAGGRRPRPADRGLDVGLREPARVEFDPGAGYEEGQRLRERGPHSRGRRPRREATDADTGDADTRRNPWRLR